MSRGSWGWPWPSVRSEKIGKEETKQLLEQDYASWYMHNKEKLDRLSALIDSDRGEGNGQRWIKALFHDGWYHGMSTQQSMMVGFE